jgi:hypothetical protein
MNVQLVAPVPFHCPQSDLMSGRKRGGGGGIPRIYPTKVTFHGHELVSLAQDYQLALQTHLLVADPQLFLHLALVFQPGKKGNATPKEQSLACHCWNPSKDVAAHCGIVTLTSITPFLWNLSRKGGGGAC